jgi:hypothetical protein
MFVYGKFMIVLLLLGSRPFAAFAEGADNTPHRVGIRTKVRVETSYSLPDQHSLFVRSSAGCV